MKPFFTAILFLLSMLTPNLAFSFDFGQAFSGMNFEMCTEEPQSADTTDNGLQSVMADAVFACPQPQLAAIKAAAKEFSALKIECAEKQQGARSHCLEKCSPDIRGITAMAGPLLSALKQASVTDACGKMSGLMNILEGGLTAFNANCGLRKMLCDKSCSKAKLSLAKMEKLSAEMVPPVDSKPCPMDPTVLKTFQANLAKEIAKHNDPDRTGTVAQKAVTCGGYAGAIASATTGVLSAVKTMKDADQCKKETEAIAQPQALDCKLEVNANNQKCICENNPRLPGCMYGASTDSTNSSTFGSATAPSMKDSTRGAASLSASSGEILPEGGKNLESGGGDLPGASQGGGSGLDGGGSMGAGGTPETGGVVKKLSTNVYGGEGGGGGGAYGRRGSSADNAKALASNPSYLKNRELASLRAQVSSQGGKSNWEKVKERYGEKRPSLLGP